MKKSKKRFYKWFKSNQKFIEIDNTTNKIDLSERELLDLEVIPEKNMELIKHIYLKKNNISVFPINLHEFSNLRILNLADNHLRNIPKEIESLKNLESLNVKSNRIATINPSIKNLNNLSRINVAHNNLGKNVKMLGSLKNIKSLNLQCVGLHEIPEDFSSLKKLRILNLSQNYLEEIPEFVHTWPELCSLNLKQNRIEEIPASIKFPQNLENLYLADNNIKDLPHSFKELKRLKILNLKNTGLDEFPEILKELEQLSYLNLENNNLEEIPHYLNEFTNLEYLNLRNNNLDTVPDFIFDLQNLTTLFLHGNNEIPEIYLKKRGSWKKKIKTALINGKEITFFSGEIIIRLKKGFTANNETISEIMNHLPPRTKISDNSKNRFKVKIPVKFDEKKIINKLESLDKVKSANLDHVGYLSGIGPIIPNEYRDLNDLRRRQWAVERIRAPWAWNIIRGNNQVLLAIIDSGLPGRIVRNQMRLSHPDLGLNNPARYILCRNYTETPYNNLPRDALGHGSHVTGIACAETNNNGGIVGINWISNALIYKIADLSPRVSSYNLESAVEHAVNYANRANRRLVINVSAEWYDDNNGCLESAVRIAENNNAIIIAASGNSGNNVKYPARYSQQYENVIAVGATDRNNVRWIDSCFGPELCVVAPGVDIYSTKPNYPVRNWNNWDSYDFSSGTSMACPFVAALVSLILSINSTLPCIQVRNILQSTSINIGDFLEYGFGLIDCEHALNIAGI